MTVKPDDMEPIAAAIADLRAKTGARIIVIVAPNNVPDDELKLLKAEVDAKLNELRRRYLV